MNKIELVNLLIKNTFMETLGIEFIERSSNSLLARMPIHSSLHQPTGCLHGGVTAALAESTASMLSLLCIDRENQYTMGMELSTSYIRSKKKGTLFAKARMLHLGKSTHVIQINICDENKRLIAYCKMTHIILFKTLHIEKKTSKISL